MKRISLFILTAIAAVVFTACGPAANTGTNNIIASNTNTNTAKPTAAAPTADVLMAMDQQANEAYIKGDSKFFEGMLSDKFVMYEQGQRMDKASVVKMIASGKCEVKDGWKLEKPEMAKIDGDTYVLTYTGTFDGTCPGPDGKQTKMPSPIRAASVWVRSGDKWLAAFHGENPIIDPTNAPKADAKPPAKPADKKPEPKKDDAKKGDKSAANSNTAANTAAPAKATPDPNTNALVEAEKSGWKAWMAKDAKKLDEFTAKSASVVGAEGAWFGNRADAIKYWAEMPCENVKAVTVTDGFASALSPTVEMLTFKGTADGTCYGQKNASNHGMDIYIKEGDAWKLAFGFSYPS